jgi:hypothetical protein
MRAILRRFLDRVRVLAPSWWIQIKPYSAAWDKRLTWLLDSGYRFNGVTEYNARIGDHEVWIANHPYGSFTFNGVRPRRVTMLRAYRMLTEDMMRATEYEFAVIDRKRLGQPRRHDA